MPTEGLYKKGSVHMLMLKKILVVLITIMLADATPGMAQSIAEMSRSMRQAVAINFRQSGGFAGVNLNTRVRLSSLPGYQRRQVSTLVSRSNILRDPDVRSLNPQAADVFIYDIEVRDDRGRLHTATFDDTTLPNRYRGLVDWLKSRVGGSGNIPGGNDRGWRTVSYSVLDSGNSSGIEVCTQAVIRTQGEFRSFWRRHMSNRQPLTRTPGVDFSRNMVLAIMGGTKPHGGYSVSVTDVKVRANEMRVSAVLNSPPSGGMTTQALTQPYELVVVPKFLGRVEFRGNACGH